jgi:2-desacetyl-2-hydroxyethyl bacteriochlorophyllide A dehydrogenase
LLTQHKRALFPKIREMQWEYFTLPANPEPYDIFIEAEYSLISIGTEIALYTGTHIGFSLPKPPFPMMPQRPGYALVGIVTKVGVLVEDIKPGMHVMVEAPHGTAAIIDSRTEKLIPLPEKSKLSTYTLVRMADIALTSLRVAPIQLGDDVLIYGMGLVGILAAQLYQLNGAHHVIGIDLLTKRLEIAEKFGIIPINPIQSKILDQVNQLTNNRGFDVIVEATGNPKAIPEVLGLVSKGGRVVLLGSTRGRVEIDVYSLIHRKGVQLIGAHESVIQLETQPVKRWSKKRDLALLVDLFKKEKLQTDGLISHIISYDELPDMYKKLSNNPQEYLGVLIDWK